MKRFAGRLTVLLLWSVFSPCLSFAKVSTPAASIVAKAIPGGRVSLQMCQDGLGCKDLVRSKGFTSGQWGRIQEICYNKYVYEAPARAVISSVVTAATTVASLYLKAPMIIVLGGVGTTVIGSVSSDDVEAAKNVEEKLNGVLGDGNFTLSLDSFVSLKKGISQCAKDFVDEMRMYQFMNNCKNIFNPSECTIPEDDNQVDNTEVSA